MGVKKAPLREDLAQLHRQWLVQYGIDFPGSLDSAVHTSFSNSSLLPYIFEMGASPDSDYTVNVPGVCVWESEWSQPSLGLPDPLQWVAEDLDLGGKGEGEGGGGGIEGLLIADLVAMGGVLKSLEMSVEGGEGEGGARRERTESQEMKAVRKLLRNYWPKEHSLADASSIVFTKDEIVTKVGLLGYSA
mmetsp:Transcript_10850/g.19766  ORF Transcript_10850/g.19766 Transcript_10850/m.19766 type:complete len:189 (-) Transcript_10850:1536-2102(-)